MQGNSGSQDLGKWQGVSTCPPHGVLEEMLSKGRASANGKGCIFEEFEPREIKGINSANLDLSPCIVYG